MIQLEKRNNLLLKRTIMYNMPLKKLYFEPLEIKALDLLCLRFYLNVLGKNKESQI